MCFSLATSDASSTAFKSRAESALLNHALKPSMFLVGVPGGAMGGMNTGMYAGIGGVGGSPLDAYELCASALYARLMK